MFMKKIKKLILPIFLCWFLFSLSLPAYANDQNAALEKTAQYLLDTVKTPGISAVGGEWTVLALARSGYPVPQSYYDGYYSRVEESLTQAEGKLSSTKYTEYSRLILALSALGKDVTNVAGYNLLTQLADFNMVKKQGITGPVFALLALDCQNYDIPQVPGVAVQTTRQGLIDYILGREITENAVVGGFSLDGESPDPDVTGMVLQALAPYRDQVKVKAAVARALQVLDTKDADSGTDQSSTSQNAESLVQVILADTALGLDPGTAKLDALLQYVVKDGSFQHILGAGSDLMATEQGLFALVAYARQSQGKTAIYDMTDLKPLFSDVVNHWARSEIETMAQTGYIKGTSAGIFEPERTMTRAEFVAILVRILGLTEVPASGFSDVGAGKWYDGAIGAYAAYASLKTTGTAFRPETAVTREEAASFLVQGAKAGKLSDEAANTALSAFTDAADCTAAYRSDMAVCVERGFITGSNSKLLPKDTMTRAEAATVLGRLIRDLENK